MLKDLQKRLSLGLKHSFTLSETIMLIVLVIVIGVHFVWLGRFPSMSHDEVEQAVSAVSYMRMGQDSSGYGLPLSLFRTETEGRISAIPPVLLSFFLRIFPATQFSIRIFYAFIYLICGFLVYKIAQNIFQNKTKSLLSLMLFMVYPWGMMLSHWAADVPFAMLFTLGFIYYLTKDSPKNTILGVISLTLAFYSYHGAKPLFVFLLMGLVVYKKDSRSRVIIGLFGALVISSYVILELFLPGKASSGRLGDTVIFQSEFYQETVNERRRNSVGNPLNSVFVNKYTLMGEEMVNHYLLSFSPETLFIYGDTRATYRLQEYGLLYALDSLMIVLGVVVSIGKRDRKHLLLVFMMAIAPLATVISSVEVSVINRSFLLLPVFSLLAAEGVYLLFKRKSYLVSVVYLFLFIGFCRFYFYEYPVSHQENSFTSERVLASYVARSDGSVKVITSMKRTAFMSILFYNHGKDAYNFLPLNNMEFIANNVEVTDQCPDEIQDDMTYIVSKDISCGFDSANAVIVDEKDAGAIFSIYNDRLCDDTDLSYYRRYHYVTDYEVEKLDSKMFCERWLNKES